MPVVQEPPTTVGVCAQANREKEKRGENTGRGSSANWKKNPMKCASSRGAMKRGLHPAPPTSHTHTYSDGHVRRWLELGAASTTLTTMWLRALAIPPTAFPGLRSRVAPG